jgi:hypothetical protein
MNKSVKASLLSALVFPGSGHFFLKKLIPGALLAIIAIVCLYVITVATVEVAQEISTKIQTGEIPLDVSEITAALSKQQTDSADMVNVSTYLFVICWIIGIIDSFRIGRSQDKADKKEALGDVLS